MENDDRKQPRQRAIIYASSTRRRHLDSQSDGSDGLSGSYGGTREYIRSVSTTQQQQQRAHARRTMSTAGGSALSVPNWFDLPLILPESNAAAARLQRGLAKMDVETERLLSGGGSGDNKQWMGFSEYQVPKISQLSPTKEMMRQKTSNDKLSSNSNRNSSAEGAGARLKTIELLHQAKQRQHFQVKSHLLLKKRRTTHAGTPVVLDRIDRKSRLREKIRKDLSKFGLWYMADELVDEGRGGGDDDAMDSVDATVDSIMQQWEDATASAGGTSLDSRESSSRPVASSKMIQGHGSSGLERDESVEVQPVDTEVFQSVFLTATPTSPAAKADSFDGRYDDDGGGQADGEEVPEGDEDEDDGDEGDTNENDLQRRLIRPPGMKRRQRLKELHYFVEKQLQKRLYKSWDTIEIAFTGSGDLTTSQIVKFLQNSDVQLSAADAAKVQAILDKHAHDTQAKQETEALLSGGKESGEDGDPDAQSQQQYASTKAAPNSTAKPATHSYKAFRHIFLTKDNKEAVKWKREFDREKIRQRQEKEIYEKELAALEEKGESFLVTLALMTEMCMH